MFSRHIPGTNAQRTTLNWWQYWIGHCLSSGVQSFYFSFLTWKDLLTDNHKPYQLLKNDDPFQCCYDEFWFSLGDDDTYPKSFLEELLQMSEDVRTGKMKIVPFTSDMMNNLKDLVGDMIEDTSDTGTEDL